MKYKEDDLQDWIEKILTEGRNVTKWESSFVESVSDQLDRSGHLSPDQIDTLERIYTERTP